MTARLRAAWGWISGDYDRDGLLDIYITHFSDDYNTLFRNLGQGRFRDMTRGAGPDLQQLAHGGLGHRVRGPGP